MSTLSLAESVRQSFIRVETSLNGHQKLNSIKRDLKRRILPCKTIFLLEIKPLLAGSSAGAGDLSQHHSAVQDSFQDAHIALEGITRLLEEPEKDTEGRDRAPKVLRPVVAGSGIVLILKSCWCNLMAMFLLRRWVRPNTEAGEPVMKNLELRRSPQERKLQGLLVELEKSIASLREALQLAREPAQSGLCSLRTSTPSSLSVSALPGNRERFQVKSNRDILDHLYHTLSREVGCPCHFIHLCLRSVSVDLWDSILRWLMGPGSICSLFVTLNLKTSMDTYRHVDQHPLHLTVSGSGSGNMGGMPRACVPTPPYAGCSPPPCSNIVTSPVGSRHHLAHPDSTRTKFLLKSACPPACCPNSGTLSNPPKLRPVVTLRELLESHSQKESCIKLVERDRFLLAAKLARWVLQHYGTPWLRGLNTCEIRFFTRYEPDLTCNYANWTPYISTTFNRPPPEHDGGLYNLGLVLLELGLKEPLTGAYDLRNSVPKAALRRLLVSLGRSYTEVVEKLLSERRGADSIEEKLIKDLEQKINLIEEKALKVFSG